MVSINNQSLTTSGHSALKAFLFNGMTQGRKMYLLFEKAVCVLDQNMLPSLVSCKLVAISRLRCLGISKHSALLHLLPLSQNKTVMVTVSYHIHALVSILSTAYTANTLLLHTLCYSSTFSRKLGCFLSCWQKTISSSQALMRIAEPFKLWFHIAYLVLANMILMRGK